MHSPEGTTGMVENTYRDDARNYFRVDWSGGHFPSSSNNCGNGTCYLGLDDTCICQTFEVTTPVFDLEFLTSSQPSDLGTFPLNLHIGSVDPNIYDKETYNVTTTWVDSKYMIQVWQHSKSIALEDTIIGVTENGNAKYFKNKKSVSEGQSSLS